MGMRIFLLAAGLILSGCATDQCASLTEPADIAACQANQRQANWRALAIAAGSMSNSFGDMQNDIYRNQAFENQLQQQQQQVNEVNALRALQPAPYVAPINGASAPPSLPPGYVSPGPGLEPYFVPPPPGINANQ